MKKLLLKIISFVFVCSALCAASCSSHARLPKKTLTILTAAGKTVVIDAEIARTEDERNYGFMNRRHIPDGTGMLFIFENDQMLSFWMKNTPTPLSIAYIDYAGRIRDIFDMTPYSLADINSTVSVRYALEVPQGWFERDGISKGDLLTLNF